MTTGKRWKLLPVTLVWGLVNEGFTVHHDGRHLLNYNSYASVIGHVNTRVYIVTHFLHSSCDVDGSFSPPMAPSSVVSMGVTTEQGDEKFIGSQL